MRSIEADATVDGTKPRRQWRPFLAAAGALPLLLLWSGLIAGQAGEQLPAADPYSDHSRLLVYIDADGREQPVRTKADWERRRDDILRGMEAAMGPLPAPATWPAFDVQVIGEFRGEGYLRRTLMFSVEEGDRLPCDLYFPDPLPTGPRLPAMLALHPTGALGKRIVAGDGPKANRAYALDLVHRGYVVLAPDYPSFGDYPYDFAADAYVSGTMKGIVNHKRCVDLLQSLPEVDPRRIGVIGHSLGGHNAMFVAAFDPRIQVIVSSCGWTPFHDYYGGDITGWTSDRYMPRLKDVYGLDPNQVPFDFYEVVAALAPRPFFSNSPEHDHNFDVSGVRKAIPQAREVYRLLGAEQNLQLVTPACEHDFPAEPRAKAFAFIDQHLLTPPETDDYSAELPRIPPLEPAEALASFEVAPGFRLEQTAAEPLVTDPVAMCFDENGRLFVIEMNDYSEQETEQLGRVRILVDTNGDGRFDESTLFADKLSWPTAILCYDGGVFVGAPPDLFYLKDTDGDGRADERRVLFTGFSRENVQGMMNSLRWGLDNRVHGATGTAGGVVYRPDQPDEPKLDLRGRDFSFDPRFLDLRPESGGAQHGMCFDDWGRKFCCSNSDHCQFVMYDDRSIARNPNLAAPGPRVSIADDGPQAEVFRISPVEPWRIVRTRLRVSGQVPGPIEGGGRAAGYFTGSTGVTIYRGDAYPEEFHGMAVIGDVGSNIVHRKRLTPDGVGFRASRIDPGTEFVRSQDIWFRPVQFANAPDGCLHILDMYREVIEHPKALPPEIKQHVDLTSGRDRGRLYRVVPEGYVHRATPRIGALPTPELVALLAHPNAWHRETASRLLFERRDESAVPALRELAANSLAPLGRLHALYSLAGLSRLDETLVLAALADPEPGVREHAVRLAEQFTGSADVLSALSNLADDSDPRVRYQLAFTAGELPLDRRLPALDRILARDGGDRWTRLAALSSLSRGAGTLTETLLGDGAFLAAPHATVVLDGLVQLIGRQKRDKELNRLLDGLTRLDGPARPFGQRLLVTLASANRDVRARLTTGDLRPVLASLIADAKVDAANAAAPAAARAEAARLLGFAPFADVQPLLAAGLDQHQPVEVQRAAVQALGQFDDPHAMTLLLDHWKRLGPSVRADAEESAFSRPAGATAMLTALEAGALRTADVSPARLQLLKKHPDRDIRQRAAKLASTAGDAARQEVIDRYRSALTQAGDAQRGRAVFQKTCAACHRLGGLGNEIGPNLATIRNRGKEAILLNVLDPSREVNPQFVNYVALTTDGLSHTGMIQSETATSVTLLRAENKSETLLRSDIDELLSTGLSLMPEGLERDIDPAAMADLLAFLLAG